MRNLEVLEKAFYVIGIFVSVFSGLSFWLFIHVSGLFIFIAFFYYLPWGYKAFDDNQKDKKIRLNKINHIARGCCLIVIIVIVITPKVYAVIPSWIGGNISFHISGMKENPEVQAVSKRINGHEADASVVYLVVHHAHDEHESAEPHIGIVSGYELPNYISKLLGNPEPWLINFARLVMLFSCLFLFSLWLLTEIGLHLNPNK